MNAQFESLTHGTSGLVIAYGIILASVVVGLFRARVRAYGYLIAPLLAAPLVLLAGLGIALLQPVLSAVGLRTAWIQIPAALAVMIAAGIIGGRVVGRRASVQRPQHRRGAFVSYAPVKKARESRPEALLTLAGVPIPLADETKHFKIIGTTGTGKSTAIRELLSAALARGDRMIIADPDGGYLNRYYDPKRGDVILNPFDPDAHKWDLFGEISEDYDIEELTRALIPEADGDANVWNEYARTVFSEVIRQMRRADTRDDRELYRLLKNADDDELRMLLKDTSAARFLKEGNDKMLGSTQAVLTSALKVFEYTTHHSAPPMSVRQWVRGGRSTSNGGRGGVLFLPYKATEIAALRRLISAWMRLGIFEAMNCGEGDQRLWFIVDELDALGEIDGLKDALARLRKFGGRCVLGLQSIAQASGLYGRGTAETIVENCGNTLILRCSASERGGTSEFASKLIGQREVMHTTLSTTRRSGEWRSSNSSSEQLRIEPAVMASEIERLPDLTGFLKLASVPDWRVVTLTVKPEDYTVRAREPRERATTASAPFTEPEVDVPGKPPAATRSSRKPRARKRSASKSGRKAASFSPLADELDADGATGPPPSRDSTADRQDSNAGDPR